MKQLESATMHIRDGYILIGATVGLIVAGLAPAIVFGYSLYHALIVLGWSQAWATVAGGALGVTMEIIGGASAHVAHRARNANIRYMAYGVLAVYTLIGIGYMAFFEPEATIRRTGIMAYLVAPLLYVVVALLSAMSHQDQERSQDRGMAVKMRMDDRAWERQQAEAAAQRAHEARMEKMRLGAQKRSESGQKAVSNQSDWRLLTDSEKARMVDLTSGEIAERYNVSDATARRWLRNARQLTAQVSGEKVARNGHVKSTAI